MQHTCLRTQLIPSKPFMNYADSITIVIFLNLLRKYITVLHVNIDTVSKIFIFASALQILIEILSLPRDLITITFCYQISLKPLKILSLSHVSFPLAFPLCYILPYEFTNSDKGKYKGKKII